MYAWTTDPHLNFVNAEALHAFIAQAASLDVDGLFITGDIAEADSVIPQLNALNQGTPFPLYFVLGNHDYYGSSIASVRQRITQWSRQTDDVYWLPESGVISLSESTALVGHGGWGDGRIGDFLNSNIRLNDYVHIEDLVDCDNQERLRRLNDLGTEAANRLEVYLRAALDGHQSVVVLTHVPPYLESCWYQGQIQCNEWTPHFTCGAMGDMLSDVAQAYPHGRIRVLCGHTHHGGRAQIRPNLIVDTGDAHYGSPHFQTPINID